MEERMRFDRCPKCGCVGFQDCMEDCGDTAIWWCRRCGEEFEE